MPCCCGRSRAFRRLAHAPPGLYALCYHRVPERHRAGFSAQIAYLQRHGRFVGADEAVTLLETGAATAGRHFLVTFDDGYADTVEVALPVLRAAGVPAILFLVSDWLDAPPANPPGPYADRAMVAAWLAAGMAVGSHGCSHARIATLGDAAAEREIAGSREVLAAATGVPIRHFACPWGVAARDYLPSRDPDWRGPPATRPSSPPAAASPPAPATSRPCRATSSNRNGRCTRSTPCWEPALPGAERPNADVSGPGLPGPSCRQPPGPSSW